VFHGLSHLDIPAEDASRLHDVQYTDWVADKWRRFAGRVAARDRVLPKDAPLMADLYAGSERGYLLNAFAHLWSDIARFQRDAVTPLTHIVWNDARRARIAAALYTDVSYELSELFLIALWDELRHGFSRVCDRVMHPRSRIYAILFAREMESLLPLLPGLERIRFVICYPLRRHGRLLRSSSGERIIAVGVADPCMGVPHLHPVMQACHEYFVRESLPHGATVADYATVPGRHGYDVFASVESKALRRGAAFFAGSQWQSAYTDWLAVTCPGRSLEELLRVE
jgi:hypothetical protein